MCECGKLFDNWKYEPDKGWVADLDVTKCPDCRLRNCPFCGSSDLKIDHVQVGQVVRCIGCGASGPLDADGKKAAWMWNTRT